MPDSAARWRSCSDSYALRRMETMACRCVSTMGREESSNCRLSNGELAEEENFGEVVSARDDRLRCAGAALLFFLGD